MHHLLLVLVCCLIVVSFGVLSRRYPVEKAYSLLVSFPTLLVLVAIADESWRGIQPLNHQLLHVAYDSRYAHFLLGLIILIRAVLKRKLVIRVAAAAVIAGIPLGHIFTTQP